MINYSKSVFRIFTELFTVNFLKPWEKKVRFATGTGFCIQLDGQKYYLTCHHVVEDAISIKIDDIPEKCLYFSRFMDLALLSCNNAAAEPLEIGHCTTGSPIRVIGFPLNLRGLTVTAGVISKLTKIEWFYGKILAFHIDAEIMGGNSGGPALNSDGLVCGTVFGTRSSHLDKVKFITPYFMIHHFLKLFKSGQPMHYRTPKFNWQTVDEYMPYDETVIVNGKDRASDIEGITILRDGQISIKDFLNYLGLTPIGNEFISFHYLIPFLDKNTVKIGQREYPLITFDMEPADEPEYTVFGDFIFVPFSKAAAFQLIQSGTRNTIVKPVPTGPKGQYFTYIAHSKLSKYRGRLLNIFWPDFQKKIKSFKETLKIPFLGDSWTLYLNWADRKKTTMDHLLN
jgi:hypothetical protein